VAEQSSDTRQTEGLSCRNEYCGFYEPTERITTNLKTSIQNPYLPCKPILYNTMKKILNQMRYGEKGRIVEIKTAEIRGRLMGMNIRIGKEVKMLAKQQLD